MFNYTLSKMLLSELDYQYKFGGYSGTCYGKTKRFLIVLHLTGKNLKIDNNNVTDI